MYTSSDEIPLSLVYGSEATVLPIENKVFKRRDVRTFNKRVKPGKMKVEDKQKAMVLDPRVRFKLN